MKKFILISAIGCVLAITLACSKKSGPSLPPFQPIEQPVKTYGFESTVSWADEFDYTGAPDANKWTYDTGGSGWGNNELQNYTTSTDNAMVKDGALIITAKKESSGGRDYSSARVVSRNNNDMLYGRYEIKAKLPSGTGTWPAIWMLPNDYAYGPWPNSGEIDIMEHVGYDPNNVHFSVHNQLFNAGNAKTSTKRIETAFTDYHVYRCDWTPETIKGYYDDELVFTYTNDKKGSAGWPYDKPFHFLLNIAVGGNWGGVKGVDNAIFPVTMQVDYVRFYKLKS
ncbi:glycoside hydrolase family 16 protein [Mucilaginibacter sp. 44-25]|uniref:glycoside hydrolase family 16 protein n=1 Tax=Mucilaginibacter sp. 44-25 TaxID=1895794 RepID=UPI000965A50F|nr:glycoside hydrolase family 16 protein [Mucilaginibacter sp. 44-25]OJW13570.1 MAG: glycoside hydrolase [Mucilaginibacter sp. 44-25]